MHGLLNSYIGDYYLTDFLGAGGMGEVYLATHRKISRMAAIKILSCFDPHSNFNRRFVNEARIQAGLHHPNIATLYDFLEFKGRPCIIMEFVDGQTLYERINANGPLPIADVIIIFQAVVEAISYIHEKGILHRDIKSRNIKISSSGQVKLLDFGIAKDSITPGLTLDGHYVGTLSYLSPEQIMGKKVDTYSDIWSLGILLHEMVTGRLPFESQSISELYKRIRDADYVDVSVSYPGLPEKIEKIITRCLKQKPDQRFSSAEELLKEIRAIPHEPLIATPQRGKRDFSTIRISSFFKEYWLMLTSALIFSIVLITGICLFSNGKNNGIIYPEKDTKTSQHDHIKSEFAARDLVQVKIDTNDGRAGVYQGDQRIGQTPYIQRYPVGSEVKITLRRKGYQERVVEFEVGEIDMEYSGYSLKKISP